ncbi:MAG: type III pantothenate kinase [Gammaproteobacteria bacterium]|nr:type III pantothenate kinase [Gammaproteobacteria bacterium]
MDILLDIGNSCIKWAIASNENIGESTSFMYQEDQLERQLDNLFSFTESHIDNVYVSNVAGEKIKSKLIQWVADRLGIEAKFARSQKEMHGLISAYSDPTKLGVDRFLAMLAAQTVMQGPKVVVDCGTAVTVDSVDANNVFAGGLILPGLSLMRASLSSNTSDLTLACDDELITPFAKDTQAAISSGTVLAVVAVIEMVVGQLAENTGLDIKCIVTGGDGKIIQANLGIQSDYRADLVLNGLRCYFQAE